jgi:hypothetical protein
MVVDNLSNFDSSQADLRAIFGSQGGGKTCLATALVVDDCYANLTGIINLTTGEYRKARPLNEEEARALIKKGVRYHPLKHIRVYSPDGVSSKIVVKPDGWVIDSPIKVFANYHFYGIRFKYIGIEDIVESINDELLTNAWLCLDESVLTDKQDSMTALVKMVAKFMAQARRRKLHAIIIAQEVNMVASRFIMFSTTRAQCSYDKNTHIIDFEVSKNSDVMQSSSFYAPDYWKFYKHDEIVKQPQSKVNKLLADLNDNS